MIKIKEYFKKSSLNIEYFVITILLISAFLPRIYLPYITITITGIIYLIVSRKNFNGKQYLYFAIGLLLLSTISWLYNFLIYKDINFLGLVLWWGTYLYPFLILILVSSLSFNIHIKKVFKIYTRILLFEFIFIFFQAVQINKLWGDFATGTCWSTHILGIHFAIGIIIMLHEVFQKNNRNISVTIFFLLIFYLGLIMTAYKAQIVILMLILVSFFLYKLIRKIILYKKQIQKYIRYISTFMVVLLVSIITVMFTYILSDMETTVELNVEKNVENVDKIEGNYDAEDLLIRERWGGKIYSYKVAFIDIPKGINFISGYGPSTYTSRASGSNIRKIIYDLSRAVVSKLNLPDGNLSYLEKILKKENSKIYDKYIGGISYRSSKDAPMTSIISIWVELGLSGLMFFIVFFCISVYKVEKFKKKYN